MSSTSPLSSTEKKLYTPIQSAAGPATTSASPSTAAKTKSPAVDLEYTPATPATPVAVPKPMVGPTSSPATVDVSSWPMPVLERNAHALRARLAKDPKSVSNDERDLLAKIESEIVKRDAAVPKLPSQPPPKTGVQLCKRPVDIPVAEYFGLKHHWIKTSSKEVGMGAEGGGVPGHAGGPNGSLGGKTTLNDHTGESKGVLSNCEDVPNVDEDCVDRELEIGKPTGRWLPGLNDCHGISDEILEKCEKKPAPVSVEADAGVP